MSERTPVTDPMRVAVLGAGPKALFALESLARRLGELHEPGRCVALTIVEPHPHLGVGAAYAWDQPEYLRLNVASGIVDAHEPGARERRVPSLHAWAREHADPSVRARCNEDFPPRAFVGRYLHEVFTMVVADLRACARVSEVSIIQARAEQIRRPSDEADHGWLVRAGRDLGPFDQVLVATGHAPDHPGALHHTYDSETLQPRLVPRTLPVSQHLGDDTIPPGARVAMRGGALTFIDATLALTEGRGGVFTGDEICGFTYEPSGREPDVIYPLTRNGRLLDAKPQPSTPLPEGAQECLDRAKTTIAAAKSWDDVQGIIERTAAHLLDLIPEVPATRSRRTPGEYRSPAIAALTHSIDVAAGRQSPGSAWALGRAWALLYPSIVGWLNHRDAGPRALPRAQWQRWRDAAARFERLAFGPPLLNAQKLMALIHAGILDTSWMDHRVRIARNGRLENLPPGESEPDVLIDAVIPPAGVVGTGEPLTLDAHARGVVYVGPGRRGASVTPDGQALTRVPGTGPQASLVAVDGLFIIGRPSEDAIIGHDTLNRALHPQPERWAAHITHALHTHPRAR